MQSFSKVLAVVLASSLCLLMLLMPTRAQGKKALLLYKGSEEGVSASRVATQVDPILKSLGYTSTYHDIDTGLPGGDGAEVIVSWYASPKIADPEAYVDWMASQISQGKKVIVLGNFGAHTKDGATWMTNESLNRFFYPFGLSYGAAYTGDSGVLRVTREAAPAKAPTPTNYYLQFTSVNPENQVFMEVERSDQANSKSALVVQTPFGAMAQELYVNNLDLPAFLKSAVSAEKRAAATDKRLLGLYKGSEGVDARTNFIARFVAPTLFDLGYGIDYHDIEKGLPGPDMMAKYAGVVSWYVTPDLDKAGNYIDWLAGLIDQDKRVVILGNFGAFAEDVHSSAGDVRRFLQSPEYNRFFYPFGLEFRAAWTPEKRKVRVAKKDPSVMVWLEPGHVGHYYWIRSLHPENQQYLTVTREDLQDGESAVVVATPHGGLALESYILTTDPSTNQPRLHLDLKKFLQQSLTLKATTAKELKPDLADLKSRPPLPARTHPELGGDGKYPADVVPFKRKVLAFYQSSANETPDTNHTALAAQTILEHLGMVVIYHDLDDPNLPSMQEMESYRGIVFWAGAEAIPEARALDRWLQENVVAGRRLVLLGNYEIREKSNLSLVNPQGLYAALGVHYDPVGNAPVIANVKGVNKFNKVAPRNPQVIQQKPGWMDFERKLDFNDKDLKSPWHLVHSISPESEVGLTVSNAGTPSDVVVVSKTGGLVLGSFANQNPEGKRENRAEISAKDNDGKPVAEISDDAPWRIDPFLFFSKALNIVDAPTPDFTTLNGSRIYYSHIDGDAFGGISHLDFSSLNGEIMLKRVLQKVPLPITVSFVTKDIESRLNERYSRELEVAQEIFRLPNIEPASHTFSHPFNWELGDLTIDEHSDGLKLTRSKIDLDKELTHSLDFIDKLCPPEKRCEILLWSGKCNPQPEAITLVREKGLPNMNGGESTFSSKMPHLSRLMPLFGEVGGETQFHVSAAGDFFYTDSWTRNYDGMKELVDYFTITESPRRLRCLNVYYHFYLAEREPGIQGLEVAYQDVLRRDPAPMFASEYADLLRDYLETKVGTDSQGRIYMANSGRANTLRLDNDKRYPDFSKSQGVIGFNRVNDDLYLHLDGKGEARLALTTTPPTSPYLEKFTHTVKDWTATPAAISFTASGQGPVHLVIRNLAPSADYRIAIRSAEATVRTDEKGTLVWRGRFDGYRQSFPIRIGKVKS